eukprot:4603974-Ditylum_brightwellii.AAC.1
MEACQRAQQFETHSFPYAGPPSQHRTSEVLLLCPLHTTVSSGRLPWSAVLCAVAKQLSS